MNPPHTPGPWHVEDGALVKDIKDGPTGWFVCSRYTVCEATALAWFENAADAHLAAAAPDLLEAAAVFIPARVCLTNRNIPDDVVIPCEVPMGELRKLSVAIAKAKGGAA